MVFQIIENIRINNTNSEKNKLTAPGPGLTPRGTVPARGSEPSSLALNIWPLVDNPGLVPRRSGRDKLEVDALIGFCRRRVPGPTDS